MKLFEVMPIKDLDPEAPGTKVDWVGNNIALECPACGKVYIVSAQIHSGERPCPECGKSRGAVSGGAKSGGKAWVSWEGPA